MKLLFLIILTFSIMSCSMLDGAIERGAGVGDDSLKIFEEGFCRVHTLGALLRRYNTKEEFLDWLNMCGKYYPEISTVFEDLINSGDKDD